MTLKQKYSKIALFTCMLLAFNFFFIQYGQVVYANTNIQPYVSGDVTDGSSNQYEFWSIGKIEPSDLGMYSQMDKDLKNVTSIFFGTFIGNAIAGGKGSDSPTKARLKIAVSSAISAFFSMKLYGLLTSGSTRYVQTVVSRKYLGNGNYSYEIVTYAFSDPSGRNILASSVTYQTYNG